MSTLPEPTPSAPAAGHAHNPLADAVIRAAVDNAIHEARRHGTTPRVVIGSTPPVEQPGRPAMSSKATDDSVRMIAFGGSAFLVCGGVALVMVASDFADPTVIGVSCGGVAAVALAVARLLRRAGEAAPAEIHQHYTGPVHQEHTETHVSSRSVWNKNQSS